MAVITIDHGNTSRSNNHVSDLVALSLLPLPGEAATYKPLSKQYLVVKTWRHGALQQPSTDDDTPTTSTDDRDSTSASV